MKQSFHLPATPYFLSHSVGCLSHEAKTSLLQNYIEPWQTQGGDSWGDWLGIITQFQQQLATLLGGTTKNFCPQTNLSSGLVKFLGSVRPTQNKKIKVLMHASAFPSMGFVVSALQQLGFELVLIDEKFDPSRIETWQQHVSADIDCVLVTHVHSNTGLLSPVAQICQLCKLYGCYSVIDVAQSAGVVPIDINTWQPDVVLGSCVKWLCGGPGAGFIYLAPDCLDQLQPVDVGWFSHREPFEMDIRKFEFAEDAKRFLGGTPSIAPYALALGSLKVINQVGVEEIHRHGKSLQSAFLQSLKWKVDLAPLENLGGTLCLTFEQQLADAIQHKLQSQGIYHDRRDHTLRLSFHLYNSEAEALGLADSFNSARDLTR